jgi:amino acid permease
MAMLLLALALALGSVAEARKRVVLRYYTQQQLGVNEFGQVPAAVPAVAGTFTGVGLQVVYNYTVTETGEPSSRVLGSIRGTSVVATNTLKSTVFVVNTVVHYTSPKSSGPSGTFSTQGEADFASGTPFELAVTGGTGDFRGVFGYTVATNFRFIPPTNTSTAKVTKYYVTRLWWNKKYPKH